MASQSQKIRVDKSKLRDFVVNSTLLARIEPSRGEPTRAQLQDDLDLQLRSKFLDSFALICSTSDPGAETASAVCLEEAQRPRCSTLRVARNRGMSPTDLAGVENVLAELRNASRADQPNAVKRIEAQILDIVVGLDKCRIVALIDKAKRRGIGESIKLAKSKMDRGDRNIALTSNQVLRRWITKCPFATQTSSPGLQTFIEWASEARWTYAEELQALLDYRGPQEPPWLEDVYKIARYHSSIKSMVKFAMRERQAFVNIQIRAIEDPGQFDFSVQRNINLLKKTIKRLTKQDERRFMDELSQLWDSRNVESYFAKALPLKLTLHAEMQLLNFYVRNPECMPTRRFIGTSKKACFLCHEYMTQNDLGFQASACHQKVYPTWLPPQCLTDEDIWKFLKKMERITLTELKTGLRGPRRPRGRDSTAGPTLTATATISWDIPRGG